MSFWNQATVEPKRKFRWLLYFSGMPQFIVKNVKKPSFAIATSPHQFLNYEFYYPGRVTWNDVTITVVDPVTPDSTKSLYKILQQAGYVIPTDYTNNDAATISKAKMVTALGDEIKLSQIGPGGSVGDLELPGAANPLETWIIKNPILTSVDFDTVDYSSDEMLNISMTIKYDFATIQGGVDGAGVTWATNADAGSNLNPAGVPGGAGDLD